ncbi:MFS transporter [Paraburkholderia sp. BCC1886]|uniref:MFS transporter n=1 Tax=Paraburkholderia sp. BCC1886 TaxID=2562670 RepID=UPI0011832BA4|nr:MFS transporter [Paraburkholderia sp. BCC1886]
MNLNGAVNSGARLDRLPISGFHWKMLWLIGAGSLVDAFDLYLASGVMAKMDSDGFSTVSWNATFMSVGFLGMLIGAILAGFLGDRYGRRFSYQTNLLIFGVASLAGAFAPNIQALSALRFVMGLGLGAELVVAAGALCEFIPPSHRGRWASLLTIVINLGYLAATAASYIVIPTLGWRWMFGIAGVGALVVWIARKNMPESPRWLESVGRTAEAEATLAEIERSVTARHGTLPPVERHENLRTERVPFSALFAPGVRRRTWLASLVMVVILVTIFSFVAWLPSFMVKEGYSVVKSLGFSTLMSVGGPLGGVIGYVLGDRLGRRKAMLGCVVSVMALGLCYAFVHTDVAIVIVGFVLVTSIYTMVAMGVYAYVPEMFPTNLRLRGAGFAGSCGRGAAIVSPYAVVALYQHFGLPGVLAMVEGLLLILGLGVYFARIEAGATSLEDNAAVMDRSAQPVTIEGASKA